MILYQCTLDAFSNSAIKVFKYRFEFKCILFVIPPELCAQEYWIVVVVFEKAVSCLPTPCSYWLHLKGKCFYWNHFVANWFMKMQICTYVHFMKLICGYIQFTCILCCSCHYMLGEYQYYLLSSYTTFVLNMNFRFFM